MGRSPCEAGRSFQGWVSVRPTWLRSVQHESKAQEKAEEKKEGQVEKAAGKEEYGDLRVTDLKMVSETCSK